MFKSANHYGRLLALAAAFVGTGIILGYLAKKYSVAGRIRFAVHQAFAPSEASRLIGQTPSVEELTQPRRDPVRLIYDTDIGNDVDDVLALALIHELVNRGEAELLAVTISKDNPWCAPHVDAINTFYGRPGIPIGVIRNGMSAEDGKFNRAVVEKAREGQPVYPRAISSGTEAPEAVGLLRRVLADQPDGSVVFVTVGFLSNAARLLESAPDSFSPLTGLELVRTKVGHLVAMVGNFGEDPQPEWNARIDASATRTVFNRFPTPIVAAGFEIGRAIRFPSESIESDFTYTADHPIADAYRAFMPMPYDRPTWDLTAVLFAVRPDRGYFELSNPGTIDLDGVLNTRFRENPTGSHRYLTLRNEEIPRIREAFSLMVSSPPRIPNTTPSPSNSDPEESD